MVVQGLNNALPQQESLQSDDLSDPRKCVETPFSCKKILFRGKLILENQNSLNKNSFWSDLHRLVKFFDFFVTYGTMLRTGQYVLSAEIVSKSGYVYNFGYNF